MLRTLMISTMGAGWMPECQRHQFRWEYAYVKPAELGSLGLNQAGCAIALVSTKGRAGDGR